MSLLSTCLKCIIRVYYKLLWKAFVDYIVLIRFEPFTLHINVKTKQMQDETYNSE